MPDSIRIEASISIPVETVISLNREQLLDRFDKELRITCREKLKDYFRHETDDPIRDPVLEDIQYTPEKMLDNAHGIKIVEFSVTANVYPF